jgi:DNA-binding NarL/FixJ family response regulator
MKRILIIEDDLSTRTNLSTILRMEGYDAHTAENGAIGLDTAQRIKPDLILCDVMMPKMNGHTTLERLRQQSSTAHIPFIFLTACGEKGEVRTGMNLGADDYLTKPCSATELLAAVSARLSRESHRPPGEFKPDFSSHAPLEHLGLSPREAEVLLWIAQGKSNADISILLHTAESTIKKHLQHIFEKLGLENRQAAALLAVRALSKR